MDETVYKEIDELCRKQIRDYDLRVEVAWGIIGEMRCPLFMADSRLYEEIAEVAGEYAEDHGIDEEDIDIEEVIGA